MRGTLSAEGTASSRPELSVILATDGLELAEEVLAHLGAQTAAGRIELVLVTPRASVERTAIEGLTGFHSVRVVEAETRRSLASARAAGVAAAAGSPAARLRRLSRAARCSAGGRRRRPRQRVMGHDRPGLARRICNCSC